MLFSMIGAGVVAGCAVLTSMSLPDGPVAITGVTVIDVEAGRPIEQQTVVVDGETIAAVGSTSDVSIPEGAMVVSGEGRYLIPGLMDSHVHFNASPATYAPLCVAHGVTYVRDLGSTTSLIVAMREDLREGTMLGPEMLVTGAIVDGDPPVWPFSERCDTEEEGRAAVRKLRDAGVDQIKVYSRLTRAVYEAILDEAQELEMPITGHVPNGMDVADAAVLGHECVEHLTGFDRLIGRLLGESVSDSDFSDGFAFWQRIDEVDVEELREVCEDLADLGVHQCPTLVVMEGIGRMVDPELANDPDYQYLNPFVKQFWNAGKYKDFAGPAAAAVQSMQKMVKLLYDADVPLLVGTDLANPNVFAGSSVHREMELFQEAGLAPADILRSATLIPARFCGIDSKVGSIAAGKTASLVLLNANPLEDIRATRRIEAVCLRGQYFDRAALEELMDDVLRSVNPAAFAEKAAERATGE